MEQTVENQVLDLKIRQLRLGIESKKIAKELNRTVSAISKAYSGECPTVLQRIDRYIARLERNQAKKARKEAQGDVQQY